MILVQNDDSAKRKCEKLSDWLSGVVLVDDICIAGEELLIRLDVTGGGLDWM